MDIDDRAYRLISFATALGWIGILHREGLIAKTCVGYDREVDAIRAFGKAAVFHEPRRNAMERSFVKLFQEYGSGRQVTFADLKIDIQSKTAFQRRVIQNCRKVPYGQTMSYGQLAERSGSPRAARAVGNVMKSNSFPLIVPCHRIVGANGIGGFSAPCGRQLKRRLLELEGPFRQADARQRV
jgi:methylated-DNA-[protein]-cysteine S-methyltransferase